MRGRKTEWLFADEKGLQLRMSHFEQDILDTLKAVQEANPEVINESVDVHEEYGVFRSF